MLRGKCLGYIWIKRNQLTFCFSFNMPTINVNDTWPALWCCGPLWDRTTKNDHVDKCNWLVPLSSHWTPRSHNPPVGQCPAHVSAPAQRKRSARPRRRYRYKAGPHGLGPRSSILPRNFTPASPPSQRSLQNLPPLAEAPENESHKEC